MPRFDDLDEVLEVVREIGSGGHFLGTAHTLRNFETALFMPKLLDSNSFEQWQGEGGLDANARSLARARELLKRYEMPPMDEAVDEELQAFIRRRQAEP